MKRVVTFGELMLRLAPNGYYRFFQNDQMQATFGGGEANVAVSLANFGLDSVYVLWGYGSREEAEECGADVIVETPADCRSYIISEN